jgi:GrpB-like predicted nucleotidyltransferase (UPF0157 family)
MTEPTIETRREWCLAHILVGWRRSTGPLIRRAYKTGDTDAAHKARRELRGYIAALTSVFPEEAE